MTNVETLKIQEQIDKVKTALDKLKAETSVDQKKIQAKEIATDVTTVKEAINKELETLKGKADKESLETKTKLEEMLETLETMESSSTDLTALKAEVIAPKIDIPVTGAETMDNSVDLATITTNITTITTLATTLQSEIDAYTLAKAKMTAPEITIKEKDIVAKKLVIETKRKETQALIDKIRAARKALKIKDMAEGLPKTALEKLQTADETVLTADQTALDKIETPGRTFFEKVGDVTKKGWRKVGEGAEKTWEWASKNPGRAIAGTLGIVGVVRGISRLFKKKKTSETSDKDKTEKKGFRDRWYGKALKWGAIGTGVWFLGKRLLTGKLPRSKKDGTGADADDAMRSESNASENFTQLKKDNPEKAKEFTTMGDNINTFYDGIQKFDDGTMPTGLAEEKLGGSKDTYSGAIPSVLDNTFTDIKTLQSQKATFLLCMYGTKETIIKSLGDTLSTYGAKFVNSILGMTSFTAGIVDKDNLKDKMNTFLAGENSLQELQLVFRKMFKVISYINYAENAIIGKEIEKTYKAGEKVYKKGTDDKREDVSTGADDKEDLKGLIDEIQEDPENYKIGTQVASIYLSTINSGKLNTLSTYTITSTELFEYNPTIKTTVDTYNKKRDVTLSLLKTNQTKALEGLVTSCGDEIADSARESWTNYLPLLHGAEVFGAGNKNKAKKMLEDDAGYKAKVKKYQDKFELLKTEKDINVVKKAIDDYYATLKELATTENAIAEVTEENGNTTINIVTGAWNVAKGGPESMFMGIKMINKGGVWNIVKGSVMLYEGVATTTVVAGILLRSPKLFIFGGKMAVAPIRYTGKLLYKGGSLIINGGTAGVQGTVLTASVESEAALAKIATIAKSTENLGDITTLAGKYTSLLTKADDVNSLTYKILQQWGTAEGDATKYLTDATQIAKAKTYAEKVIELNKGVEGTVETTKIGEAWKGAKTMFKEGMEKVKSLFTKNTTLSATQKAGLEDGITKATNKTDAITGKTIEAATKNPTGEESKAVGAVLKEQLGMRARVLKWCPLLIDGVITIFQGVGMGNEAEEISKINTERGSVRDEKASFTVLLGTAEIALFAVGVAMAWNPAGWVILAITAGIETVKYAANKYYEVVETYYRNFEDFKRMYMSHIKQEIISKEAWGDGIDISLQENFQEAVSAVFGSRCHGEGKKTLSLKTREDAIRALIWMEECENYPYSTLNSDDFVGDDLMRKEISTEKLAMKADSVVRFDYLKKKYGDTFISAEKIKATAGKEALDKALLESRKYLKMTKDTTTKSTDIDSYQKETLATLEKNAGFAKLDALYISNPLQFHKIMKSLPYYSYMFQQFDKDTYVNYDTIKANMDYVVQYYNYKTFGLLPSDIPTITVEADKVDYAMMEEFFFEFKIKPTGFTKEDLENGFTNGQIDIMTPDMVESAESVSESLGQNILYRVAREVLGGYTGGNTLEELKSFYIPSEKEHNGIYYEDGKWKLNQTSNRYTVNTGMIYDPVMLGIINMNIMGLGQADRDKSFATDEGLNDLKNITILSIFVHKFTQDNYTDGNLINTDTGTAEGKINKEYGKLINKIVAEELAYRKPETVEKYKTEALAYIKENSDGKYIPLSVDLITKLTKAGVYNTGYYYYKRDGTKLTALEAVVATIPSFFKVKCGLTTNIETYQVKEVASSTEIKEKMSTIDGLISRLSTTIALDDEDLDVQADIKKMIAAKGLKWAELKIQLNHMEQTKAKEILDVQYETFKTFFDNVYLMILHCGSTGSSNDVDSYDDYLSISSYSTSSLLTFQTSTGTTKVEVAIPDFGYTNEFNTTVLKYITPYKNKTVSDLLCSKEASDIILGKKYAQEILKSILESAMIKYDDTGTIQQGICNAGAQSVDEALLVKRLAINVKTVKEDVLVAKDDTKDATKDDTKDATKDATITK
ncbi:MAG: hypothetical protein NT085_00820 [candidate division SR1 bacterium]|nr:hypothetical protein [candidate division SR1 bacterium]